MYNKTLRVRKRTQLSIIFSLLAGCDPAQFMLFRPDSGRLSRANVHQTPLPGGQRATPVPPPAAETGPGVAWIFIVVAVETHQPRELPNNALQLEPRIQPGVC